MLVQVKINGPREGPRREGEGADWRRGAGEVAASGVGGREEGEGGSI